MVNLSHCLCGDLLEVGSPAKGSRMLGWLGQLPDGQETSVGWEQDGLGWEVVLQWYLPSPPVGWMWSSVGVRWGRENCGMQCQAYCSRLNPRAQGGDLAIQLLWMAP